MILLTKLSPNIWSQYTILTTFQIYIPKSELQFVTNDQLFLETLLMKIRGKTISYSSYKKNLNINKQAENYRENWQKFKYESWWERKYIIWKRKKELEKLRQNKMKGMYIRSRAQWINKGDKPTNFFCALESKNYTSKIIPQIQK